MSGPLKIYECPRCHYYSADPGDCGSVMHSDTPAMAAVRVFREEDVRQLWDALVGTVAALSMNVFKDKALADAAHQLADGGFPAPEDWDA